MINTMEKKIYSSYDEIDRDLEILKLERKLHYHRIIKSLDEIGDHLTLPTLVEGFMEVTKVKSKPIWNRVIKTAAPFLIRSIFKFLFK